LGVVAGFRGADARQKAFMIVVGDLSTMGAGGNWLPPAKHSRFRLMRLVVDLGAEQPTLNLPLR